MLTKDELNNLRYMAEDLKMLEDELDVLYTKIQCLSSPRLSDEPRGGVLIDPIELHYEINLKQKEINALSEEYYKERERVQEIIQKLSKAGKQLIKHRYFENMAWCDIADKMAYTVRHLHRLHSTVLVELKKG